VWVRGPIYGPLGRGPPRDENAAKPQDPSDRFSNALCMLWAGLLFTAVPIHAESDPSGTYRCKQWKSGETVPCKAPSLILKSDGSYRMLSESGTYEIVAGRWLVLSASKRHGRARLDGSKEIFLSLSPAERRAGSSTGASTTARRLGCELKNERRTAPL